MYKLTYASQANRDLVLILGYYNSIDYNISENFLLNLIRIEASVSLNPEIYRIRYKNYRRVNFYKFPHTLFFEIIGKEIVVLRILHQKQDPILWP